MQKNFYKNKKSLLKLLLILTIVSYTIFYSPQKNIISGDTSYNNNELSNVYFPNTSDQEITVITPENITYTEPMEGYYLATYGFENDLDGTVPQDWFFGTDTGGTAQVVSELGDRKKVVQLVDIVTNGYPYLTQTFTSQTTGIVEFYIRKESGSTQAGVELRLAGVIATGIRIDYNNNGKFEAYQGAGYLEIAAGAYSDQTWFHIKIDFDTSTDTADFYINGALEASNVAFKQDVISIDRIYFGPNYLYTGSFYFDAVGYSWDSDYNIGDNLKEGLLLSFENSTTLDWIGYSLDGQSNKTILGNTTITMPNDGSHTIQVFGNDTFGTNYNSNIRYFTIQSIFILTPENKTYNEPMEGYYPATFGFESDSPGEEGTDINFINRYESDHSLAYVKIIDAMNDHKNVMQLYDGTSSGNANFYAYHDFETNIEFGTIEFWVLNKEYSGDESGIYYNFGNESGQVYVSFDTFNSLFVLIIDGDNNGLVQFQTGNGFSQWAGLYSEDTWHHIRIDFESTAGGYSGLDEYHLNFWFDGIKRIDNDPMMINDSLGVIATHSHGFDNVRHDYLDAVGYSWDPTYKIGDNLKEGLLLSFENSRTLDWIGYSLDGQSNKTILGNTTITMPNDGSHTIQVFGNDSLGTIYSSDIRYFSVDTLSPIITINSPLQNEYFGSTAPNFDVSITEPNLNTIWYTLDNGLTNITFTGFTGTINQTEWDDQVDGQVTIRFYANDTFGYINYTDVLINKDALDPVITINSPLIGEIFTDLPPEFNLTIDEVNLDTTWYTLDGGATTIYFSELTGYIDSTAWNNAPIGAVTIRFYARDKAGNEVYQEVIVLKSSSQQEPPPGIPGFNIWLLCLAIVIITVSSRKIKKYKVK